MNHFMKSLTNTGLSFDGVDYSSTYIEGGVFSLDGVHPNGIGYAIIANHFMETIDRHYGSNLQRVDVSSFRGVTFP